MVQHLQLRGKTYQFYLRVPQHLIIPYGKRFIRQSLRTSDLKEATRKAEELTRQHMAEFKLLTDGKKATPAEVIVAARALAEQYDLEHFIDYVIEPLRGQYAKNDQDLYDSATPSQYLAPHQLEAWKILSNPNSFRLSDALHLYLKTHQRGSDEAFIRKVSRDWKQLVDLVGDMEFAEFSWVHARHLIGYRLEKGDKTTTVRRKLNTLGAIASAAIRELEIQKKNPFESHRIPGEGEDAKETKVPSPTEVREIVQTFHNKIPNVTSLMILLQTELGTRIGEVSGLGIDDVFLDHEIPHVYFRDRLWRSLKNDEGERRVPVVGAALEALKHAVSLPRKGLGLFDQYARLRGNDSASQAVDKQLKVWGITSHSFRHAMKDRLREAGCPKDIRDATCSDIPHTLGAR
ncbi:site-specific integrase [Noviherbaspirillum autotrophicum]|uniref:Tyr recombinase domain-containing protein n=1 Tax=Noviherbaspirillum autotrophicum TaxID=709839 RepID=A0A0C1Y2J6_9BURK|nr:site-specific integrase [Noviherbaspirillum autotrophicum]KIF81318.1 hypothetical protein TSA66_11570 [Noviherbaspirillum autotrophicum]